MFLNQLNEKEKNAFLKIAFYVANIDNEYSEEEQILFKSYCIEAGIDLDISTLKSTQNIDTLLKEFKSSKSKKIVLLELLALVHSDDKYVSEEKNIISKIAQHFEISEKELALFSQWAKLALYIISMGHTLIES